MGRPSDDDQLELLASNAGFAIATIFHLASANVPSN